MKTVKAILIDDERFCLETLEWELEQNCPEVEIAAICEGGEDGLKAIEKHRPDVVFLDIEMPYMNAFQMLEKVDEIDFDVIFTTAYDRFAIKAIKLSALDYLLKPIGGDELKEAVKKVKQREKKGISMPDFQSLIKSLHEERKEVRRVALPTLEGLELVRVDKILYAEADSNYTHFHLHQGSKIIISRTLKQVEEMLTQHSEFLRIHQSYLVNLNYIERYRKGSGGSVTLSNNAVLSVARNRKESLLEKLQNL